MTTQMLDPTFAKSVAPDWERLFTCIQCGICTALCPTAYAMDYTPRELWKLIQAGLRDEVLNSTALWLCTLCHSCTTRCPRGVPMAETMAALKRLSIAKRAKGSRRMARFYQDLLHRVRKHGRLYGVELLSPWRISPLHLPRQAMLRLTLWRKDKLPLAHPTIEEGGLEVLYRKVKELEGNG